MCSRLANHHLAVPFLRPFLPGVAAPPRSTGGARRRQRHSKDDDHNRGSTSRLSSSSTEGGKEHASAAITTPGSSSRAVAPSVAVDMGVGASGTSSSASNGVSGGVVPRSVAADKKGCANPTARADEKRKKKEAEAVSGNVGNSSAVNTAGVRGNGGMDGSTSGTATTDATAEAKASDSTTTTSTKTAGGMMTAACNTAATRVAAKGKVPGAAAAAVSCADGAGRGNGGIGEKGGPLAAAHGSGVAPASEPTVSAEPSVSVSNLTAAVAPPATRGSNGVEGNGAAASGGKGRGGCAAAAVSVKGSVGTLAVGTRGEREEKDNAVHGGCTPFRRCSLFDL